MELYDYMIGNSNKFPEVPLVSVNEAIIGDPFPQSPSDPETDRMIRRQDVIEELRRTNLTPELQSVMFGNIEIETGGSFDINQVERLMEGVTRDPGIGLFQKTGPTLENYRGYLGEDPSSVQKEISYYTDAFQNPNSKEGKYLGSGYMQDYQAFMQGKPSAFRKHSGSGTAKVYEPTLEGINEHFVNFMMNPLESARKATMKKRLKAAQNAYDTIFAPKK